ncbi:MAG: PspA/IM30 family protein [Anaerolineae bacterium]|nr:PspA/IM30 family protein [Anaerolineae bacterium]
MSGLLNKLNTLVRARIQGVLGDDPDRPHKRGKQDRLAQSGKDIDALRQQIDRALSDEERMQANLQTLQRQIADWDRQADRALEAGDEATARHAIQQIKVQQQRLTMLEAEISQLHISTSELIRRVNELETVIATAQQTQQQQQAAAAAPAAEQASEPVQSQQTPPEVSDDAVDDDSIDDDLARRRARLSQ